MVMALICEWAFMVLAMLATTIYGESAESCAMPLMVTRAITFRTSRGGTNDTEYAFDRIVCNHESLNNVQEETYKTYENLKCVIGNIIHSSSYIRDNLQIGKGINGLICKTKDQPNLIPNSSVYFSCEISGYNGIHCDHNNYCLIEPASLYQRSGQNLENWQQLIGNRETNFVWLEGGYGFECPEPFICYWQKCSSILIIRKQGIKWEGTSDNQLADISLQNSLEGILKTPSIVKSLEIIQTNVSHLPNIICQFKDLHRLVLVYNNLTKLPDCLHKMIDLEILDVSFNALTSIQKISFGSKNTWEKILDLSFNQITHIQEDAFKVFDSLLFLILRNNLLTETNFDLPVYLHHLDLSYNKIKSFRAKRKELLLIETLLLQHNEIETVNFYIPETLISLDLSHNHLEILNGNLFSFAKKLQTLSLNNNRIKAIIYPDKIPQSLKSIILNNNRLENLDFLSGVSSLIGLEIIDVSYNNIEGINNINILKDETMLPNVKDINLSHNRLREAPLNLMFIKQLQTVDFSHNQIETCTWFNMGEEDILKNIDNKFKGFCVSNYNNEEEKQIVNLEHNKIRSLKDVFGHASIMLRKHAILFCHIKLRHNPFHCDCHMFSYLKELSIYNWNNEIMATTCNTPTQLKSRSVFDKQIVNTLTCDLLPKEKCKFIYKPSDKTLTVNCSNLNLTNFPLTNETLRETLKISVAENDIPEGINTNIFLNGNNFSHITSIPEKTLLPVLMDISLETHINILDLSHSHINEIDNVFLFDLSYQLPHLTQLHLNDNNLTNLPLVNHILHFESVSLNKDHIVPFWNKVAKLHLYNNPWDCSCRAQWMKKWLNRMMDRKILVKPDEMICATPEWNRGKMVHMIEENDFCTDPRPARTYKSLFVLIIILTALVATMVIIVLWQPQQLVKREILNILHVPTPSSSNPRDNLEEENDAINAPRIGDETADVKDRGLDPSITGNVIQVVNDGDERKPFALSKQYKVSRVENDGETTELLSGNNKACRFGSDNDVVGDDLKLTSTSKETEESVIGNDQELTSPRRETDKRDADGDNGDDDDDITVLSISTDSTLDYRTPISFGRDIADDINKTIPETLSRASQVDNDDIAEMNVDVFASFSKKGSTSNTEGPN